MMNYTTGSYSEPLVDLLFACFCFDPIPRGAPLLALSLKVAAPGVIRGIMWFHRLNLGLSLQKIAWHVREHVLQHIKILSRSAPNIICCLTQ